MKKRIQQLYCYFFPALKPQQPKTEAKPALLQEESKDQHPKQEKTYTNSFSTFSQFLYTMEVESFKLLKESAPRTNQLLGTTVKDFKELSFELVKIKVPDYLEQAKPEPMIVEILKEAGTPTTEQQIHDEDHHQVLYFLFWVLDSLEEVNQLEIDNLQSFPEPDMLAAGIHELNQFGILNTVDSLAQGDILKWELVVKKPYYDVFTKLLKDKKEAEFNKRYTQLLSQRK